MISIICVVHCGYLMADFFFQQYIHTIYVNQIIILIWLGYILHFFRKGCIWKYCLNLYVAHHDSISSPTQIPFCNFAFQPSCDCVCFSLSSAWLLFRLSCAFACFYIDPAEDYLPVSVTSDFLWVHHSTGKLIFSYNMHETLVYRFPAPYFDSLIPYSLLP